MSLLKIEHSYTASEFDKNRTFACNLHLYHARKQFAYMVTNMSKTHCLLFKSFQVDDSQPFLHELALEHEEISRFYRTAVLMPANQAFSMVPGAVYAERHAADYYQLAFGLSADDSVLSAEFEKAHVTAVMAMNTELWKHYKNFFQSFKILAEPAQLFENVIRSASRDEFVCSVMLYPEQFIMVLSRQGNILLSNRFPMENNEELLYFIVNSCEQLKIDPAKMTVNISGEPSRLNEVKAFITPYVNQASIAQLSSGTDFSLLKDVNLQQKYFTFLETAQCE